MGSVRSGFGWWLRRRWSASAGVRALAGIARAMRCRKGSCNFLPAAVAGVEQILTSKLVEGGLVGGESTRLTHDRRPPVEAEPREVVEDGVLVLGFAPALINILDS